LESLKEKNKKHARRFGMNKKELLSLALGTVGLMGLVYNYSNVQAGSLTNSTGGAFQTKKVAKELVDADNVTVDSNKISFNNNTHKYTPSDVLILENPYFVVSVDVGKINVASGNVAICNETNNETIGSYVSGSGSKQLLFESASSSIKIYSDTKLYIGNSTCNGTAGLEFVIPKGASSVTLTIKTLSGTTVRDEASATIFTVAPQFSASVKEKLSKQIGSAQDFKKFTDNTTTDNGTINLSSAGLNVKVQDITNPDNATFKVTLKPTDMAGIANATINDNNCTKDTDKFICNFVINDISSIGSSGSDFTIQVNVSGTDVLAERSFKVDALLDFVDTKAADKTFFTNADFGEWTYKGTTIYVPIIGHAPERGRYTTIRLQSRDTSPNANKVTALILASDGSVVTADLGQITAGTPFTITGGDLKAKVEAAGKTVGDTFAAILIVTTAEDNLFAYAVFDHQGVSRRVPLKVKGGQIVE